MLIKHVILNTLGWYKGILLYRSMKIWQRYIKIMMHESREMKRMKAGINISEDAPRCYWRLPCWTQRIKTETPPSPLPPLSNNVYRRIF